MNHISCKGAIRSWKAILAKSASQNDVENQTTPLQIILDASALVAVNPVENMLNDYEKFLRLKLDNYPTPNIFFLQSIAAEQPCTPTDIFAKTIPSGSFFL